MSPGSKLLTPAQGAALVLDGASVGLGGMLLYRRPIGLVLELLRSGVSDLTLLGWTLGFEADLLIGAARARRVRASYVGLESFGLAPMFKRAAEQGGIEVVDETESTLAFGLRAALQGTGFMPARALTGTDYATIRPDIKTVTCPYSGEVYPAMPALRADVALVHALQADQQGNAVLGANLSIDLELAMLAQTTIVSAEEIVPAGALPEGGVDIPGHVVTAVVELPGGAAPTSCFPRYHVDGDVLLDYLEACAEDRFDSFVAGLLAPAGPPGGGDDVGRA